MRASIGLQSEAFSQCVECNKATRAGVDLVKRIGNRYAKSVNIEPVNRAARNNRAYPQGISRCSLHKAA
jgi:hypothetical protein